MERLEHMEQLTHMEYTEQPGRFAPPRLVEESAWLASRLLHRQVVDVSTVEPVGRVVDLIFDPKAAQVMALVIQPVTLERDLVAMIGRLFTGRRTLATIGLDHIISMDSDVVMVNTDPFHLTTSREIERMPRLNTICEMAILTMRGTSLGSLADLVLTDQGTNVAGYVVNPTPAGEQTLPSLDDMAPHAAAPASASAPRTRVIPASSNVRIGESLILLVAAIEPLRDEVVVVTSEPTAHS